MRWAASRIRSALSAAVALALGASCTRPTGTHKVLEFADVFQYNMEMNPNTHVPSKISGLCGKSMLCVLNVKTIRKNSRLVILVEIGACGAGRSGSFSYPLILPDEVDEIAFGRKEHVTWKRNP